MKICKVENCNNKFRANDYCNKHNIQMHRHGKITPVILFNDEDEVWVDIEDSKSSQVSNKGRVRTKRANRELLVLNKIHISHLKTENISPRLKVNYLNTDKVIVHRQLSNIVAKHFLDGSGNVLFKDGDYKNCSVSNLCYTYDYECIVSESTIERYSTFKSKIGIASYQFVIGNKEQIYKELLGEEERVKRILGYIRTGGNDYGSYFLDGVYNFIAKLSSGFLQNENNLENLLIKECQFAGLRQSYNNKVVTTRSHSDNRYSVDVDVYSDINGNVCDNYEQCDY